MSFYNRAMSVASLLFFIGCGSNKQSGTVFQTAQANLPIIQGMWALYEFHCGEQKVDLKSDAKIDDFLLQNHDFSHLFYLQLQDQGLILHSRLKTNTQKFLTSLEWSDLLVNSQGVEIQSSFSDQRSYQGNGFDALNLQNFENFLEKTILQMGKIAYTVDHADLNQLKVVTVNRTFCQQFQWSTTEESLVLVYRKVKDETVLFVSEEDSDTTSEHNSSKHSSRRSSTRLDVDQDPASPRSSHSKDGESSQHGSRKNSESDAVSHHSDGEEGEKSSQPASPRSSHSKDGKSSQPGSRKNSESDAVSSHHSDEEEGEKSSQPASPRSSHSNQHDSQDGFVSDEGAASEGEFTDARSPDGSPRRLPLGPYRGPGAQV